MSGSATDPRDVLRRALVEIRDLKARLAAAERAVPPPPDHVAVVGMGCRFPGEADSPDAFWRLLSGGQDAIGARPAGRWSTADDAAPREGGFLADVEGFDARFFAIAPREAAAMDPQHRLLLEVAWEALEHAAIDPHRLAGSRTGVFIGLATNDFARRMPEPAVDRYFGVGSSPAVASGRIAYLLDLRGPCVTLDTACSSSLVAVHYAMRALRDHDCDTALAGGVSLMLHPSLGKSFVAAGMLAPDGRCKSFDASADGYGRGEGAGVVVLRRLADALRDGDPVLAVLRGSAMNQDGRSAGLTAPNGPAQTMLINAALDAAGMAPGDIDYVEAHGTGTPLGDPIEWHALAAAFAGRERPLLVGSVKSNIGHTEAAAGIAGLIKAVLAVNHGTVPPSLHFSRRNPTINGGATPLEVPVAIRAGIRRAGVSAFGFSGTNAHVVLEAPSPRETPVPAGGSVLLLSAHDPAGLRELAARYAKAFAAGLPFAAACHTAATGRARLPWWIAVRSASELAAAAPSDGPPPVLAPTAGMRVALPTYPFQRERFPLPGGASAGATQEGVAEQTLTTDNPLFAGTGGLAHLGVLLALLDPVPDALAAVLFPAPLMLSTPRIMRVDRREGRITLQSRVVSETEWATHMTARVVTAGATVGFMPPEATPGDPADALYEKIAACGFRYGAVARCLERIAIDGDIAHATLVACDGMTPGTTEAAAQLAYAMLPLDAAPVMLAGVERLTRFPGGPPANAWLRRTGASPDGGLQADFGLYDATGRLLLQAEGAAFAPLPDQSRRWSRLVAWDPAPLPSEAWAGPAQAVTAQDPATVWHAPDSDAARVCAELLAMLPGIGRRQLRIVTRGAQLIGDEASPPALGQAAAWGMAQAIMAEQPALRCRLIDLDPDLPRDAQQAALDADVLADDEPAIAWRGRRRLARRFVAPAIDRPASERATLTSPGVLRWQACPSSEPGPGMVRIAVVAAGLTFRDRLLFNGLGPGGASLGSDCAGVVDAVGPDVSGLRPGDRVVALADDAIADSVTVPALAVAPAPCADLVAAATMPVPYLTALAGLADLGPADCVLVHQAASATGLAALSVARRAGARVIATAGRQRHAWFGSDMVEQVLDSRDPGTWAGAVQHATMAFGAFDPALERHLESLRVVNLDKRAARHFDLDRLPLALKRGLMDRMAELPSLPRRVSHRADLAAVLSGDGPLVGRGIVLMREPPPTRIERGSTYLVTGAAGALGGMVAGWLAQAGARLCLVDRIPVPVAAPHASVQADAGDSMAMEALLARLAAGASPLRGVFHCAAMTDDDRLEQQTPGRLAAVLKAKVDGALVLDRLTRGLRLDHFVLFASVAGVLPSARQGGYAAANAVLDQIARGRRQRGLPGLSLDWGPWQAGIGLAMGVRAAEAWRSFGVTPILPAAGLRALPALLASPEPQRIVADMSWEQEKAAEPARSDPGPVTVARLQAVLAPLLGVRDPATLDPDVPLLSVGLDSLTALEFARALSRELGRPVAPDFIYNHPTLAQAVPALAARRPATPGSSGFVLRTPRWETAAPAGSLARGWAVAGEDALAAALRAALPDDPANLVDLTALHGDASADDPAREELMRGLLTRLRQRLGQPGRIVLAVPPEGPLTGALEGFAASMAAEQPAWTVRTVRVDPVQADAGMLVQELAADDDEPRVWLTRQDRQVSRLTAVQARGNWQASPDAAYLVTGGSGGIGSLVAAHLVARGARHLVLAARRPSLPPALAGSAARVRLRAVDMGDAGAVAALMAELRAADIPLKGIFHAAGVTADGTVAAADWSRLARAFPAKADGARLLDLHSRTIGLTDFVLFSSTTAWFGLPGTAGYAAANGFLDGLAQERRTAGYPAQSIAWCAWQGVGMAADEALWQGDRVPSLPAAIALAALDAALMTGEASVVVADPFWRPGAGCRLWESRMPGEQHGPWAPRDPGDRQAADGQHALAMAGGHG